MCGICGILFKQPRSSLQDGSLLCRQMTSRLSHRGPDTDGFFEDPHHHTYLGHRRLSIMDLSEAGRQPLWNEKKTLAVLVNGEFYNFQELRTELTSRGHIFSSQSDAEVLVHLFEDHDLAVFEKLRGMYAVAIYDPQRGRLILARDPLGIKPIYLFQSHHSLAFCSEISPLKQLPDFSNIPHPNGVLDYLLWGSIPSPHTLWEQIQAIQPGEIIEIIHGKIHRMIPVCPSRTFLLSASAPPDLSSVIRDSVRRHLISDAPIGLFLSGGIDSGTLAGLATEVSNATVHTLSVTLPNHPLDESFLARLTSKHYGTQHIEVALTQQDFESDLEHFFKHLDAPSIDGFNTYVVSKAARQAGLKVAISGIGGDELFAGYPSFQFAPKLHRIHRLAHTLGHPVSQWMASLIGLRPGGGAKRSAELIRRYPPDIRLAYLACRSLFMGRGLESLLLPDGAKAVPQTMERFLEQTRWIIESGSPMPATIGMLEFSRYMTHQLLRDTDVLSMAHSLEVRTPLVDIEVARAAIRHLGMFHPTDAFPKWGLRQVLNHPLPTEIVRHPKQGFVFPWNEWLRGKVIKDFDQQLANCQRWKNFLNPQSITASRTAYQRGEIHWSAFWGLYVLIRMLG